MRNGNVLIIFSKIIYNIFNFNSVNYRLDFFQLHAVSRTARCRVGRRNLVLRHYVPYFPLNSGRIAYWMEGINASLANTNIKYIISLLRNQTHNLSRLQLPFRYYSNFRLSLFPYYLFKSRFTSHECNSLCHQTCAIRQMCN